MTGSDGDDALPGEDFGAQLFQTGVGVTVRREPRRPCVLLLDTSATLAGAPVVALNQALLVFRDELRQTPVLRQKAEVAVVTCGGGVRVPQPFATADEFEAPVLHAAGDSPLGSGILKALDLIDARKAQCRAAGVPAGRPWVFLVSGGGRPDEPLDVTREAVQRVRAAEAAARLAFLAVGVGDPNLKLLAKFSARPPARLHGLRFVDLFVWLARSAERIAESPDGEPVLLPAVEWGNIVL